MHAYLTFFIAIIILFGLERMMGETEEEEVVEVAFEKEFFRNTIRQPPVSLRCIYLILYFVYAVYVLDAYCYPFNTLLSFLYVSVSHLALFMWLLCCFWTLLLFVIVIVYLLHYCLFH